MDADVFLLHLTRLRILLIRNVQAGTDIIHWQSGEQVQNSCAVSADVSVRPVLILERTSRKFRHVYRLISKALLIPQLKQNVHLPFISSALVFSADMYSMHNIIRWVP